MRKCGVIKAFGAVILIGCLLTCSNLGKGTDGEDDGNNPFVILDLRTAAVTDSTVTLKWTATGDDANQGTASQYDLRVYREMITNANWDSAAPLSGEPAPRPAGETDSMVVTGFMRDSTYFFAINACDEAGNWSGRSNCAQATCFTDYVVTFPDTSLEGAVRRMISKPTGEIHRIDLIPLVFLEANGLAISDMTGLEHCSNLETIFMSGNHVSNLGPISHLPRLRNVQFTGNDITEFSQLAGVRNLAMLVLRSNALTDISPVSGMTNLHWLDLAQTGTSDISPLVAGSGLGAGDTVYLEFNPLSQESLNTHIPALEARGVFVNH